MKKTVIDLRIFEEDNLFNVFEGNIGYHLKLKYKNILIFFVDEFQVNFDFFFFSLIC